jgi:hypothetical protein
MKPRSLHLASLVLAGLVAHTTLAPTIALAQGRPAAAPQDLVARGRQLFDDQQYEESIQTLSAALVRPNNTREQKVEILRLLALDYITLNRKDESESAVRGLLALDPDYALPATESPRFRDFFVATKEKWEAEGRPGLAKESEPPPVPVSMAHASPSQVEHDTSIPLSARITDPQHRVASVHVFYRTGSKGKFAEVDAQMQGGLARATIPGTAVKPPLVEYYIEGLDAGGLALISRGDAAAPLRVAVPEPSKGWVLPVAIGGAVVGAAAIIGGLALAGVFKGSGTTTNNGPRTSNVSITIGE